ncbi:hypothetical protein KORDIASMS9_01001 [Kordia sp. SMS9]|uniref:hypothetical protein n=1 Tax=Kordia sp. SMS9 TaxID=2282170 RepID=UPI000E0DF873|nr:hypothetical protein [Kordia sp. SMS9]AXG68785.1 hypothetical protein KORDIASMS9_01001 [Kordia sp. SMS9]
MKKKNLIKKLQFKKTQVSNFNKDGVVGGLGSYKYICEPIDLSVVETCLPGCDLTVNCTNYTNCNEVTFANCTVNNCATNNCGTNNCGTNDCNPSGGISCPGYVC